jgi:mRNA interferase RelE/StbE
MRQATEIYSREFDAIFMQLPPRVRQQIEDKIREMGRRLEDFSHHRLQGRPEFRLRAGDYRIIYEFDLQTNVIRLVTLGHRREVYRR